MICVKYGIPYFTLQKPDIRGGNRTKQEVSLGIIYSICRRDNCSLNDIDGHKRAKGVKRHIVVYKTIFLLDIMVTIACVHDNGAAA